MTLFYLVRHGEIDREHVARGGNPADPPLSAQGRAEAEQVALSLRLRPIARVYASDLRRAQETAAPLAVALNQPVVVEPLLRERINFGDLPNQSYEEFVALWERCSRERDFVPPVGDSSRAAGQRVERFVAAVHEALPTGEVVAITHGGLIADFLLNVFSLAELAKVSPAFAVRPYAGEVMRNGSITVVEFVRMENGVGKYRLHGVTLTEHLPNP
jgi:broad specificity phosphatase PhoE